MSGPDRPYAGLVRSTEHGPRWTGRVVCDTDKLEEPLHWRQPRDVFVDSMGDLFHEDVPLDFIRRVFAVMEAAHWHRFKVLTKRAKRLGGVGRELTWPRNVWMGVSVESADYTHRIDHLRTTGARVKFLSLEPLLGPLPQLDLAGIASVIVGGESGPSARPCNVEWIRAVVRQCRAAQVACFVKQLGARPCRVTITDSGRSEVHDVVALRHPKGGDPAEWPEDLRVREVPHGR